MFLRDRRLIDTYRNKFLAIDTDLTHMAAGNGICDFQLLSRKKASLITNAVEDFGDRRLLLSSRAIKNIQEARKRPGLFADILQLLRYVRNTLTLSAVRQVKLPADPSHGAGNHCVARFWLSVMMRPSIRSKFGAKFHWWYVCAVSAWRIMTVVFV